MRTHRRLILAAACLTASVLVGGQSASAGLFSRGGSHGSSGGSNGSSGGSWGSDGGSNGGSGGGSWGSNGGSGGGSWGSHGSSGGSHGRRGGLFSRGGSHGSSGGSHGSSGGSWGAQGAGGGSWGAQGSGGGSWGSDGGYHVGPIVAPTGYYAQVPGAGTDTRVAYVNVRVPADSTVYLQNQRMTLAGAERRFATPPLAAGRHRYTVRVEVVRGGRTISKTTQVVVQPGQESEVAVSFDEPGPSGVTVASASR